MRAKTLLKIYLHLVILVLWVVLMLGVALPFLTTQNNWSEFIIGILLFLSIPPVTWWRVEILIHNFKTLKKEIAHEKE